MSLVFSLPVNAQQAVPDISVSPTSLNATVGIAINPFVITNNGGTATYSISPDLPAGLSIDTATGTISGTPTVTSDSRIYKITATNDAGSDTATIFGLSVQPGIIAPNISVSPSMLTFTVGIPVTTNPITITNSGGPPEAGFLISSNGQSLRTDTGLSYNHLTGVISGTPTRAVNARIYTIRADNAGGTSRTTITITVNAAVVAPDIPSSASPYGVNLTVGVSISPITIVNSGGAATYSISPDLPAGLSIDSTTGTISGTPTAATTGGAIEYTITATNSAGSDSIQGLLTVQPRVSAPEISVSPSMLTFTVGIPVTTNPITIVNSGGAATYSISPDLPAGLSIDSTTGTISGTPTAATTGGAIEYTITATNSAGSDSIQGLLTVQPRVSAPEISVSPSMLTFTVGIPVTTNPITITNNGGHISSYDIKDSNG